MSRVFLNADVKSSMIFYRSGGGEPPDEENTGEIKERY
jgi:hypothetical protein